jgi:lipoprotein-anchoring transpeptidase ErfK/SrfK
LLNKISLILIFLIIGIAVLAGNGSFKPSISSAINEQNTISSQTDSQGDIKLNINNPKFNRKKEPNNRNDSNEPNYRIEVSTSEQKVRIFDNDTMIKEWTVSTGKNNSTPLGDFTIQNRGEWFFSEKYQEGAKWWVSFKDYGIYLFHTVPMDRQKNIVEEQADKLGEPASHGCVRMRVEDAKWIYDNIPEGTPVHIE